MKDLKYLAAYIVPVLTIIGLINGGWMAYGAVLFAFVFVPVAEFLLPISRSNYSDSERDERLKTIFFDWLLYLNLPVLYGILVLFGYVAMTQPLTTAELVGNVLSVGLVVSACGINVAHELGHRQTKIEQILAKALLLPALYMHFFIEHNRGHHKYIGTEEDPASARLNESLYAFWMRSSVQGYVQAWKLEGQLLKSRKQAFWSWKNEMIRFTVIQLTYLTIIFLLTNLATLFLLISVGIIGFMLLETINYIEHYGLRRKKLPSGRYERVLPIHSWNANYEVGRIVLYELTRHSDHHYLASKKYQILDHHDDAPELPFGYPTAMILSFFPPLWFAVMNKQLENQLKTSSYHTPV